MSKAATAALETKAQLEVIVYVDQQGSEKKPVFKMCNNSHTRNVRRI